MKKSLLILSVLLAVNSYAQTAQPSVPDHHAMPDNGKGFATAGCVELGGSVSYENISTFPSVGNSNPSTSLFLFAPFIGYFPVNGFELGLNPISVTTESASGSNTSLTSIIAMLAPSYNINTGSSAFPFFEAEFGLASISEGPAQSLSGFSEGGRVGVKIAIKNTAILNISLQYLHLSYSDMGFSSGTNNILAGVGFTVAL